MAPQPVKATYDLASIAVREPFYVRRKSDEVQIPAMMVAPAVMLIVNPDGSMDAVMPSLSSNQRSWQFVRYFTEYETLSISGSIPLEGSDKPSAARLDGIDIDKIPTHEQIRKHKSTSIIPDGLYFHIKGNVGSGYYCVNCPPRKGLNQSDYRSLLVVSVGSKHIQQTSIDLTTAPGWEFVGYLEPSKVPDVLREYPRIKSL